jgi:N6-L-threonylcarbamoyladenine synthase
MIVLGIETSCDETSAAVVTSDRRLLRLRSLVTASQVRLHRRTFGVVPEVAARAHVEKIIPVIERALRDGRVQKPDVIAVTAGPGLLTSLLVGVDAARTLSFAWDRPLVAVQHIAGHIYANWLMSRAVAIRFPVLALVVSGGHTELVLMAKHLDFHKIGETVDDAAGEAFDKVARILGLAYPGGPAISVLAKKGDASRFFLPRPMLESKNYDFSFSGLKTATAYLIRDLGRKAFSHRADIAAAFEQAVVDVLAQKTIRAAKQYRVRTVLLAGGVAANQKLRTTLQARLRRELPQVTYRQPSAVLCTDNGAMTAAVGAFFAQRRQFTPWGKLSADPNWELPRVAVG